MRVIAGTARGMRLKAPPGFTVRPTADRVKEALFSSLGPRIIDAFFIDFYAGSGAIGIEALSRGAHHAIFVDNRKNNIQLIRDNLIKTGLHKNSRLILANVEKAITMLASDNISADLIYLDPPYSFAGISALLQSIIENKIINEKGMLIVEHASANRGWIKIFPGAIEKKYGDTCLTFITLQALPAGQ